MFSYRVGTVGWRWVARLGLPLHVVAAATFSKDDRCWVAESNDFQPYLGLLAEADEVEGLKAKLHDCALMGLEEAFPTEKVRSPIEVRLVLAAESAM